MFRINMRKLLSLSQLLVHAVTLKLSIKLANAIAVHEVNTNSLLLTTELLLCYCLWLLQRFKYDFYDEVMCSLVSDNGED